MQLPFFSWLNKIYVANQTDHVVNRIQSNYEFENKTSNDFLIWRFPFQGHSLDTFPKEKFIKRPNMSLSIQFHSNNNLDFLETEHDIGRKFKSELSHVRALPESWYFSVLLKIPTLRGHMKGLSIWEVLLPNHKYFIYSNQWGRKKWGGIGTAF